VLLVRACTLVRVALLLDGKPKHLNCRAEIRKVGACSVHSVLGSKSRPMTRQTGRTYSTRSTRNQCKEDISGEQLAAAAVRMGDALCKCAAVRQRLALYHGVATDLWDLLVREIRRGLATHQIAAMCLLGGVERWAMVRAGCVWPDQCSGTSDTSASVTLQRCATYTILMMART
jgi:hypothetical protein